MQPATSATARATPTATATAAAPSRRRRSAVAGMVTALVALGTALPGTAAGSAKGPDGHGGCDASVPFVSGEGATLYRVPAIVRAADGALVAFAEARETRADTGPIDIVSRRSSDGGCTWGPRTVVADQGEDTIGNPAPVVDPVTGDIVLLSTRNDGDATETEIRRGEVPPEDSRRAFVQTSRDDGRTFSRLREITPSVKRPDWRWYATGPGHGIALTRGDHRGRLIIPSDHTNAPPPGSPDLGDERKYNAAHSLYSDDHGQTWQIGFSDDTDDGYVNSNETTAAELPDGTVYFNTRDGYGSSPENRADATSHDGGETLTTPFRPQPDLAGPIVQASVLQIRGRGGPLLYSGPSDPGSRAAMAIRVSEDGGRSWQHRYLVSDARAGYSDLVQLPGGQVGLLYETGETDTYATIRFVRIDLGDIAGAND
ncbi:sialidase family protein [Streptomyces sp. WMMC500]|uniref:sialidase family protein n=1 Tax=Streptomyces sp. WMMC500 TaxID=3015154 RepID=UPI00248C536B|nr:sialidase family protein [Streptomyces sp. WMMC500]WBB58709.1 sialidase family protein [Streptomyces sp. WMMC500]